MKLSVMLNYAGDVMAAADGSTWVSGPAARK